MDVLRNIARRSFLLSWITGTLAGLAALALGGAGLGYVLAPGFARKREDWVDIGSVKDIPVGIPVKVEYLQRKRDAWVTTERRSSVWAVTSNGRDFIVFDPHCTHLGCPYRWDADRKQFLCPCHSAVFDVDGRVLMGPPPRPLDRFPSKILGDRLLILPASSHPEEV